MESKLNFDPFLQAWEKQKQRGVIPARDLELLKSFYLCYKQVAKESQPDASLLFLAFMMQIEAHVLHPFSFPPFHQKVRFPFDYYQFGYNFIAPLLVQEHSQIGPKETLKEIEDLLAKKENVVFFANHQTEADPQILSALLRPLFPKLAEELIFVAGSRVTTDPLAVPFSQGTNLLCIHSKRYIDHPPEEKEMKQRANQRTMEVMRRLLTEGGKAIYVAPSGGRDRKNEKGEFCVAPFDPSSIEMFYLMAKRAKRPTHFYPMALKTYPILPPPNVIQHELGEERIVGRAPVYVNIGKEISMEGCLASCTSKDKKQEREYRSQFIHHLVASAYARFPKQENTK